MLENRIRIWSICASYVETTFDTFDIWTKRALLEIFITFLAREEFANGETCMAFI